MSPVLFSTKNLNVSFRKIARLIARNRLKMCLGDQMNRLIETALLSTHKICFG